MNVQDTTLACQQKYVNHDDVYPNEQHDPHYDDQYSNRLMHDRGYFYSDDEDAGDEFSEGELEEIERFKKTNAATRPSTDDTTDQLLRFADRVNEDIQRYFLKHSSCIVNHGDNRHAAKSGRELYYADLLRIARGMDDDEEKTSPWQSELHSGKMDETTGLGPLAELFAHLHSENDTKKEGSPRSLNHPAVAVPMNARKLPSSFFDESKCNNAANTEKAGVNQPTAGLLNGENKTPDFSDLLESWTGEDSPVNKPRFVSNSMCSQ